MSEPEKITGHNAAEYTVSEISTALKRMVEQGFAYVRVKGELSGAKLHSSGHLYMSLKDDKSVLSAVCWKGIAAKLRFKPEDGMEVICTGRITTYPGKSQYQLVVDWMEPAGIGALMAALEQLKKKLLAEGLFESSRKKAIPFMPQTIGVVTSPTGAVIRDILHRIRDRFPCRVIVWPVAVQGEGAKEQITDAINGFNAMTENRPDVLIVARGGGSIEDLWAFNEEIVVRAAANSKIPLISAVGHETDTTLIDFVSDLRAPTPTAAAEKAVPVRREVEAYVNELSTRKTTALFRLVDIYAERVRTVARALPRPQELLANASQRLDDWNERLAVSLQNLVQKTAKKVEVLAAGLSPAHIIRHMEFAGRTLADLSARIKAGALRRFVDMEKELKSVGAILSTLDQKSILKRGFAIARDAGGVIVKSAAAVAAGDKLLLEFADGNVSAVAENGAAKLTKNAAKKPAKKTSGQQTLF